MYQRCTSCGDGEYNQSNPDGIIRIGNNQSNEPKRFKAGHGVENVAFEPNPIVEKFEEALRSVGRPIIFCRYPGTDHGFFEPDRTDAYNQAAAKPAWERTLAFLKRPTTF